MSRALLLAALIVFSVFQTRLFLAHDHPSVFRDFDGVHYLQSAETGEKNPAHGPGYPAAIRLVSATGLDTYSAAKLVSRVSGAVMLIALWVVFKTTVGPGVAGTAALLIAACPIFVQRGHEIMSDALAAAMLWVALALAVTSAKKRSTAIVMNGAMGIVLGIAYLTRYAFLSGLVIPAFLLTTGKEPRSQRVLNAIATLLGFALVAGPRLFEVATTSEQLFGENHGNVAFKVLTDGVDMFDYDTFYNRMSNVHGILDVVRAEPAKFFGNWLRNFTQLPQLFAEYFALPHLSARRIPLSGMLMVIGIPLALWKWDRRRTLVVVALVAYITIVATAWFDHRILLPALPVAALLLAAGIQTVTLGVTFWARRWQKVCLLRWPVAIAMVAVLLRWVSPSVGQMMSYLKESRVECEVATAWLRDNGAGPGVPIACDEQVIATSAHERARALGLRNYMGRGNDLAHDVQGGFLVLDARSTWRDPQLARYFRWLGGTPPADMRIVYRDDRGRGVVIYAVGR